MKIIFTPVRFFPFQGGVEHSSYHLSKHLVKLGNKVKVICALEGVGKPHETIDGIEVERLPYIGKLANTNISLRLPLRIAKESCDIIQTYMPTPWSADWSILIGKLRRKKTVIYIKNDMSHSTLLARIFNFLYINTVFRFSLNLVDKIFMVNQEWQEVFVKTGPIFAKHTKKIVIIPNGIETDKFSPQKVKRQKNELLFVSIFSKYHGYKGLDDLLEALQQVRKTVPDVRLKIAGDGELRPHYVEEVKRMGLAKNVIFAGKFPHHELPSLYSASSMFVLPSKGLEGHANVVLESLACGTPVVVSNVVGMATDITEYNCGKVVLPSRPKQLADAIIELLSDDASRRKMEKNAVELIQSKYKWSVVAKRVQAEYRALLES
jgi:glycosyltransferase involved in cell wall biosynthesis